MKYLLKFLVCFVLATVCGCSLRSEKVKHIEKYFVDKYTNGEFEGSISIGNGDGVIFSKSWGVADRGLDVPLSNDFRYDIASLNKSFIAYMIMQLVEMKHLSLADLITDHMNYTGEYAEKITIHQMLTHTSGMPDYDAIADSLKGNRFEQFKRMHFNPEGYLSFIGNLPAHAPPGVTFHYSNFAYHLLAQLIEQKTNMHFSEALDSMICKPLALTDTYAPFSNYEIYEKVAKPYLFVDGKYIESPFIDYSLGRRIFSTSTDLNKWAHEVAYPTLISTASQSIILSNHLKEIEPKVSYGYGWAIFDGKGDYGMGKMGIDENYFVHGGATDGYRSILTVCQESEWIVSILANNGGRISELKMAEEVINILNE